MDEFKDEEVVFEKKELRDTEEMEISDDSDSDEDIFPNVERKLNFDEKDEENSERAIVIYDQKRESEFQNFRKGSDL